MAYGREAGVKPAHGPSGIGVMTAQRDQGAPGAAVSATDERRQLRLPLA